MFGMLQDLDTEQVVPAIEANLAALWASYGCIPNANVHDEPDLCWVATDIPFPPFNGVVRARLHSDKVDSAIAAILQPFVQRQVPMLWLLPPSTSPSDLARHLLAHGLVHYGEEPGMALDLDTLPPELPTPSGFTVEAGADPAALRAWCGFTDQAAVREALFAWGMATGFDPDRSLIHYLGRLDGRPIATSSLLLAGGVAGIYNVMTVPDAQRQGIGALMTVIPLRQAHAQGYQIGVLQSSRSGLSLYRRLGFNEYCRIPIYLWHGDHAGSKMAT